MVQINFNSSVVQLKDVLYLNAPLGRRNFNSSVVQLKATDTFIPIAMNLFQFLSGTIKSAAFIVSYHSVVLFQFLSGTIKRPFRSSILPFATEFQFLSGTIKRRFGIREIGKTAYISIPQWYN